MANKEIDVAYFKETYPLLNKVVNGKTVFWENPHLRDVNKLPELPIALADMKEAEALWQRFAPFFEKAFPEMQETNGVIESPIKNIEVMKEPLNKKYGQDVEGNFYLKCDNELPIAGSIKARGGFYEVLHYAEKLAIEAGIITKKDNYEQFASDAFREFFNAYSIGVGSTGNLGLSIGIISAKLGFHVTVYMSEDAKQWKKDLLRERGAEVKEYVGDFSVAINTGRKETLAKPKGYFVDDEDSMHLYLGYSVAALGLKAQLEKENIRVDQKHPLFVYLPCGVGGSPGGITFGLKQVFGDHVHCFFVEPTQSPAVLIGLMTGLQEKVSVQDFDLDNRTEADGLAVGRPSKFATSISDYLMSGLYTIEDEELFQLLVTLYDETDTFVEPSATAGLKGPWEVTQSSYMQEHQIDPEKVTHLAWATGGALVPEKDRNAFYKRGKML